MCRWGGEIRAKERADGGAEKGAAVDSFRPTSHERLPTMQGLHTRGLQRGRGAENVDPVQYFAWCVSQQTSSEAAEFVFSVGTLSLRLAKTFFAWRQPAWIARAGWDNFEAFFDFSHFFPADNELSTGRELHHGGGLSSAPEERDKRVAELAPHWYAIRPRLIGGRVMQASKGGAPRAHQKIARPIYAMHLATVCRSLQFNL